MRLDYSQVCRVFSWLMTDVTGLAYCRFSIPRHVLLNCIKYQAEGATTIKPVLSISPYLLLSLPHGSCIEFLLWLFFVVSYEVEVENEKNSFHHKLLVIMVFISARKPKREQKNWYQREGNCLDRLDHALLERTVKALLSFGTAKPLSDQFSKSCSMGAWKIRLLDEMQMIEIWLVKLQKEALRLPQRLPGPLVCYFKIRICVFSSSRAGKSAGTSHSPAPLEH